MQCSPCATKPLFWMYLDFGINVLIAAHSYFNFTRFVRFFLYEFKLPHDIRYDEEVSHSVIIQVKQIISQTSNTYFCFVFVFMHSHFSEMQFSLKLYVILQACLPLYCTFLIPALFCFTFVVLTVTEDKTCGWDEMLMRISRRAWRICYLLRWMKTMVHHFFLNHQNKSIGELWK